MTEFVCEYCSTALSSRVSLYNHQKRAKYCLTKRGIKSKYICNECQYEFSSQERLNSHLQTCDNAKDKIILDLQNELNSYKEKVKLIEFLEKQNKELTEKLENLALHAIQNAKPNITNTKNTYINMLAPLPSTEKLNEMIQQGFSRNYFVRGQIGLAEFINDCLVKDDENMYYLICSDTSRQVFRFKDQHGNVIKDPCMKQFTNMIVEPVKLKTEEHLRKIEDIDPLYIDRAREIAREFFTLSNDNTELSKKLSALVPNQTMIAE
jgi:hypothetical protein